MPNDLSGDLIKAVKKYSSILIYIQGSPDPDAIASAYTLKLILSKLKIKSEIVSGKKLSLPQNKAFIRMLAIPLVIIKNPEPENYDAYIVVDFQSNFIKNVSDRIPCVAHIDHHETDCQAIPADFSLINTTAGSTSSLIAGLLKEINLDFTESEMTSMATALMFGIQTDTDGFSHASEIDMDALKFLSSYSDSDKINKISGIPLSSKTINCYKKALENITPYKGWGIAGIEYIDIDNRDSLAITADLLLKNTRYDTVVVYALVENREKDDLFIDVSFRTENSHLDLNSIIKRITPTGGGRKYKGAYQVKIKYLYSCPDRELLWKTVKSATLARVKQARDSIYLDEIKNVAKRVLGRISSFLKNK